MSREEYKHCKNCRHSVIRTIFGVTDVYCGLKHSDVDFPRLRAIFCRFFKGV